MSVAKLPNAIVATVYNAQTVERPNNVKRAIKICVESAVLELVKTANLLSATAAKLFVKMAMRR